MHIRRTVSLLQTHMATIRELCSGRTAQNTVLGRVRIDPGSVLGPGVDLTDRHFMCPPNVPLFTSERGLAKLDPANAGRGRADENMIPVIAHIPGNTPANTLIFVGISYSSASRSRPAVTVATGGLIAVPHTLPDAELPNLISSEVVWWRAPGTPYGSAAGPHIAVPAYFPTRADFRNARANGALNRDQLVKIRADNEHAICGIKVATATSMDCALMLVPPSFT